MFIISFIYISCRWFHSTHTCNKDLVASITRYKTMIYFWHEKVKTNYPGAWKWQQPACMYLQDLLLGKWIFCMTSTYSCLRCSMFDYLFPCCLTATVAIHGIHLKLMINFNFAKTCSFITPIAVAWSFWNFWQIENLTKIFNEISCELGLKQISEGWITERGPLIHSSHFVQRAMWGKRLIPSLSGVWYKLSCCLLYTYIQCDLFFITFVTTTI